MKRRIYIFIAFAVALVLTACSSIDCDLEGRILCHYALVDINGEASELTYPLSVTFLRSPVDSDTVYINQQTSVATLDLPMSNVRDTDRIELKVTIDSVTTLRDTMTLCKTNEATFEDVDCSARYRHGIYGATSTHNFIDSLIINNPKVSNDASVTNILIRLRSANQ